MQHIEPLEVGKRCPFPGPTRHSIVFVGVDAPLASTSHRFEDQLQRLAAGFNGPLGIFNAGPAITIATSPLQLLVPTGGTVESRMATEIALALANASDGVVTALNVFDRRDDIDLLRGRRAGKGSRYLWMRAVWASAVELR